MLAVGHEPMASSGPNDAFHHIWKGNFSHQKGPTNSLKLLDWNIERGLRQQGIAGAFEREKPDICLLQEVDLNAHRSQRRNLAEELARKFQWNYVFGVEFQELSQGSPSSPAYHGQAILTTLPIRAPRILRFAHQSDYWKPRWYLPNRPIFQRREGGRMALVAELEVGEGLLVVYNAHLESRDTEQLRLLQLEEILADAARYPPDIPIVLAGDLNTKSRPSPLIRRLQEAGFQDAVGLASVPTKAASGSRDWVFVRGPVLAEGGKVHQEILASDHYPLSVRLSLIIARP